MEKKMGGKATIGIDLDGCIRHNNKSLGRGDLHPEQRTRLGLLEAYEKKTLPEFYYILNPSQVHYIDGALDALRVLNDAGLDCYVFTNQEVLSLGIMKYRQWENIRELMSEDIDRAGGHIIDWFACPHFPDEGCLCRKPKPGLFYQARDKYDLDLSRLYMIGDNPSDMQAGKAAGCKCCIHISLESAAPEFQTCEESDVTVKDLHEAVMEIMKKEGLSPKG